MENSKTKTEEVQQKALEQIVEACEKLGWSVAIPDFESEGEFLTGVILGTEDFIRSMFEEVSVIEESSSESH